MPRTRLVSIYCRRLFPCHYSILKNELPIVAFLGGVRGRLLTLRQYWFCEYSRQVQRGVSSGAAVVCGVERHRFRGSRSSNVPQLLVRGGPLLRHFRKFLTH